MTNGMILIVEDEENIANLVKYNLEKDGFKCTVTTNGKEALAILIKQPVDLVILDIMLPEMDGLEVCRRIKRDNRTASIPIIMLTAKGEETDRIVGFELGANDYVVKPFSPRELVLRVKSLLQHFSAEENISKILVADKLKVDIPRHKVTVGKDDINLTSMEFKLLTLFTPVPSAFLPLVLKVERF